VVIERSGQQSSNYHPDTRTPGMVRGAKSLSRWNPQFLWHNLVLGQRLYLFSWLRFLAAASIAGGALFAKHVVGIEDLRVADLNYCAAFLALYNLVVLFLVRPVRDPVHVERGFLRLTWTAHGSITIDYLVLTYAIWLVGGARSPFLAFYILHAMLASVLLSRRSAFAHALVGYLFLTGIVVGEWLQWIPRNRPVGAVFDGSEQDVRPILTILFVYGLLTATATYLMTNIALALRAGEKRLRAASEQIEEIADLRRSFLHVVLHDLRNPVSTVVTLLETIASGVAGPLADKQKEWIGKGEVQLRGLLGLLHDLQILADIETGGLNGIMEPVDVLPVLREVVEDHKDAALQHGIQLQTDLPDTIRKVKGVDRLIREAIANYITNAIKYALSGSIVTVRVREVPDAIRVEVIDTGPGIAEFDQARLFQEFVRIHKSSRRVDRQSLLPPSSGLGLSIVRRIAEVHRGQAGVTSALGKGSTFFIEIPAL
jgi:signal transduction histidine kinase